jgi:hypothetical protein
MIPDERADRPPDGGQLEFPANHGFLVPAMAVPSTPESLALARMQERSRAEATGGMLPRIRESRMEIPVHLK